MSKKTAAGIETNAGSFSLVNAQCLLRRVSTMMRLTSLALAVPMLALAFAASTPARADYAVIQFANGDCEVWSNSTDNPWGSGWRKLAFGLPNWDAGEAAYHAAKAEGVCH
ncbi:MAG TPA: hypothetical protein VFA80_20905 [Xanthobacteraceae bacterium]|nr:hypothetical protein [Xanthobacteraceae bacterium]